MTPLATLTSRLGPVRISTLDTPGLFAIACPGCSHTYALRPPKHVVSLSPTGLISISAPICCPDTLCRWHATITRSRVSQIDEFDQAGNEGASASPVLTLIVTATGSKASRLNYSTIKPDTQRHLGIGRGVHARMVLASVR